MGHEIVCIGGDEKVKFYTMELTGADKILNERDITTNLQILNCILRQVELLDNRYPDDENVEAIRLQIEGIVYQEFFDDTTITKEDIDKHIPLMNSNLSGMGIPHTFWSNREDI